MLGRRRLIAYLVQADMKKKGADTLLGNIWWVLDPLLQMVVYVVFISVVLGRGGPDYPLFIFAAILPWKWFQSSIQDGITSVVRRGQADPPDPVPQARAAGLGGRRGDRQLRVRADPAGRADPAALPRPPEPDPAADPGDRRVQFFFNLGLAIGLGALQRVLPRRREHRAARPAPLVLPVPGALLGRAAARSGTENLPIIGRSCCSTRGRRSSPPTGTSSTTAACRTGLRAAARCSSARSCCSPSRRYAFKRVEPSFAKVL